MKSKQENKYRGARATNKEFTSLKSTAARHRASSITSLFNHRRAISSLNFRMLTKNFKLVRKKFSPKNQENLPNPVCRGYGDMMMEDELDNIHRFLALKFKEGGGGRMRSFLELACLLEQQPS